MKSIVLATLATASLMASSLVEKATNAGLAPIPESKTELLKLIDNPKNPITEEKVELGKKLFFDPRLSKSGWISCNSCHNLAEGGEDGLSAAVGHKWTVNPHNLNSPTVYNAVFAGSQFWDGRDPDLEKQAQGPIQAAPEMAATKAHVVKTVNSIPEYVKAFKKAYGKNVQINFVKITDTIATFERTLVTPSKFDDFMNGCESSLNAAEKKGMETFINKGCATCHNGVALGGSMQMFAITAKYKYAKGDFKGNANGLVKVPTLRNLSSTAPYFHNGGVATLREAIVEMGRIQLKTLDGRKPHMLVPMLPASTATTPKPDLN